MNKQHYVYILASQRNGTLYVEVTNDLIGRVYEYKNNLNKKSFTTRYKIYNLVYYDTHRDVYEVICREKYIKNLLRAKKVLLIERNNPKWFDLYKTIIK